MTHHNNNNKNDQQPYHAHAHANHPSTTDDTPQQQYLQTKAQTIVSLLNEPMIDLWALRAHGLTNGGFVNDAIRKKVWPKLVGLHDRIWDFHLATASTHATSTGTQTTTGSTHSDQNATRKTMEESMAATPKRSNVVLHDSNKTVQDIFRSEVNHPQKNNNVSSQSTRSRPQANDNSKDDAYSVSSCGSYSSGAGSALTMRHANRTHKNPTVLASSRDATQIELDVLRCTWHLLTKAQKRSQQQYLSSSSMMTTTRDAAAAAATTPHSSSTTTSSRSHSNHRRKLRKIAKMIQRKQRRLSNLINLTLVHDHPGDDASQGHPPPQHSLGLRYYQGYHDVACIILSTIGISTTYSRYVPPPFVPKPIVLLLPPDDDNDDATKAVVDSKTVTGFEMATSILYQLSQSHFRDCMRHNFAQLQIVMRLTIFPLLSYLDSEVHEHLVRSDMMEPYFALSWIITWFSHDIRDTELVKRLFDFFIVSHPLMPIYMSIAMICHPLNREDVLQTEHDFATVHQTLSQLPRNSSMVGWKYRPGDGYVSDDDDHSDDDHSSCDDDDMDDDLLSTGPMGSQSSVDTEFLLHEAATMKQSNTTGSGGNTSKSAVYHDNADSYVADAEAVSIVSSSMSSMYNARVPFQELMDLAIQYMEKIPPKHLIALATRYYGREYVHKELVTTTSSSSRHDAPPPTTTKEGSIFRDDITFLQSPPAWTRSFTAHSDQTLKYYRTQQRRRLRLVSADKENAYVPDAATSLPGSIEPDEIVSLYTAFQSNGNTEKLMAVIAAGYSIGDDMTDIRRRKRRQRKRFRQAGTALAALVIAIGVGYYIRQQQQQEQNRTPAIQQAPSTNPSPTVNHSTNTADIVVRDSLSIVASNSNKIMATSSTSPKVISAPPIIVGEESRLGGSLMDIWDECTFRSRQLFERKCPSKLATHRNSHVVDQSSPTRLAMDDLPQRIAEFLQATYHESVTRLQIGIHVKKQELAVKAKKIVNVAKFAMIEFGNDVVAANKSMEMRSPTPIIATLRKKFEPSDLNLISVQMHSMLHNVVHIPDMRSISIHLVTKWNDGMDSFSETLLALSDASRQQLSSAMDHFRRMKQSKRFGEYLTESFRLVSVRITEIIKSPKVLDAVRGAVWLDYYVTKRATGDVSTLPLDSDFDHRRHASIQTNGDMIETRRTRPGQGRCLSNLPLSQKKKLNFVKKIIV